MISILSASASTSRLIAFRLTHLPKIKNKRNTLGGKTIRYDIETKHIYNNNHIQVIGIEYLELCYRLKFVDLKQGEPLFVSMFIVYGCNKCHQKSKKVTYMFIWDLCNLQELRQRKNDHMNNEAH